MGRSCCRFRSRFRGRYAHSSALSRYLTPACKHIRYPYVKIVPDATRRAEHRHKRTLLSNSQNALYKRRIHGMVRRLNFGVDTRAHDSSSLRSQRSDRSCAPLGRCMSPHCMHICSAVCVGCLRSVFCSRILLTEMLHSSASDHPCFKMAVVRLSV